MVIVVCSSAHAIDDLFVRVLPVWRQDQVLTDGQAEQEAEKSVPDVEEATPLGNIDQDLCRIPGVVHRWNGGLAQREALHHGRLEGNCHS